MLTEEPPVRSVSCKVKRVLNLFPGASWEGRKGGKLQLASGIGEGSGVLVWEMKPEVPQDPASERTERKKKSRLN